MNASTKSRWFLLGAIVLLVAVSWTVVRLLFTVADRSLDSRDFAEFKMVGLALREYADAHEGKFPETISDLSPESLPAALRQFRDPATKQSMDWLYFRCHAVHDSPDTLLAASPRVVYQRKRLVMGVDTIARLIDEAAFQQQFSAGSPAK